MKSSGEQMSLSTRTRRSRHRTPPQTPALCCLRAPILKKLSTSNETLTCLRRCSSSTEFRCIEKTLLTDSQLSLRREASAISRSRRVGLAESSSPCIIRLSGRVRPFCMTLREGPFRSQATRAAPQSCRWADNSSQEEPKT